MMKHWNRIWFNTLLFEIFLSTGLSFNHTSSFSQSVVHLNKVVDLVPHHSSPLWVISSQLVDLGAVLEDSGEVAQVAAGELHVPRRQRVADVRRVQRVRLLPLHLPEMKSLLDGYSWLLLVKMLLLFNLNISGRERRKVSLTLEPRWSLTPVPLPWPISCQRIFAVAAAPPRCSAAQQSSSRDSRSWGLSAPATCSPPLHARSPRWTLKVDKAFIGTVIHGSARKEGGKKLQFIALLVEQAKSDFSVGKLLQIWFCCNWRQIILLIVTAMR